MPGFLDLLTQTEFFDQFAVFEDVFLRVVLEQAFALTNHGQKGAARGVVFFVDAQVGRKAFDAVRQQSNLNFNVACVFVVFTELGDDFDNFVLVIILCHFTCCYDE
jgi:hypothetical protein